MKRSLLILSAGLVLGSGCAHRQQVGATPTPPARQQTETLDEARVTDIARQAVAANETWVERAEFGTPKRKADGSWSVLVWRVPKVPGGHRLILIDEKGKVTGYVRGA